MFLRMLLINYNRNNFTNKYPNIINNITELLPIKNPLGIILLLQIRGGIDKKKSHNGHRTDTIPICNEIIKLGYEALPIFYKDNDFNEVYKLLSHKFIKGIIIRINPGNNPGITNKKWKDLLETFNEKLVIMSPPKLINRMGSKDSLVKIRNLRSGRKDTRCYYNKEDWYQNFPKQFMDNPNIKRVIKQNNGSTGEGIWIVELKNKTQPVTLDSTLILIEAVDNHLEEKSIKEFLNYCEKYFIGQDSLIVDQKFLPRITEGEIRFNLISDQIITIIEKVPKDGGVSATLHSGAKYTSYDIDEPKFSNIVKQLKEDLPQMIECFDIKNGQFPLIWTIDYIRDQKNDEGLDTYCIGEINCTCVGISSQLEKMAPLIAKSAVKYCS